MAKSGIFTDITTPTNLSGTLTSGGTLAANTTYYYRVIGVWGTSNTAYRYQGKSLASNQITITTTSTDKSVNLTWNSPLGEADKYVVYRYTSPIEVEDYRFLGLNEAANLKDSIVNNAGTCSYTDIGKPLAGNGWFQNLSHGKIELSSTSPTTDVWSITDLYDLDVANGWGVVSKLDDETYRIDAYLFGYTGIKWLDTKKVIIFPGGFYPGSNCSYTFGRLSNDRTYDGCNLIFKNPNLEAMDFYELNAYKTTFARVLPDISTIGFRVGLIQDCQIDDFRGFSPQSNAAEFKNLVYTNCDNAFSRGLGIYNNVKMVSGSRAFQTGGNTVIRAKDLIIDGMLYPCLIIGTNNEITYVNTNITNENAFNTTYNAGGTWCEERFTYSLRVTDTDGNDAIENAHVIIYDRFGVEMINELTNIDGEIIDTELLYRKHEYSDATPSVRTTTYMSPFKIVIFKNGYETYSNSQTYDGCYDTSHKIGLTPVNKIRTTVDGEILLAIDAEAGSLSKMIKL